MRLTGMPPELGRHVAHEDGRAEGRTGSIRRRGGLRSHVCDGLWLTGAAHERSDSAERHAPAARRASAGAFPSHAQSPEQHETQATLDPGEAPGLTAGCVSHGHEERVEVTFSLSRLSEHLRHVSTVFLGVPTLFRCEDGRTGPQVTRSSLSLRNSS